MQGSSFNPNLDTYLHFRSLLRGSLIKVQIKFPPHANTPWFKHACFGDTISNILFFLTKSLFFAILFTQDMQSKSADSNLRNMPTLKGNKDIEFKQKVT